MKVWTLQDDLEYGWTEVTPVGKYLPVTDPELLELGLDLECFVEKEPGCFGLAYHDKDENRWNMCPNWNDESFCPKEDFERYRKALEGTKYTVNWIDTSDGGYMQAALA